MDLPLPASLVRPALDDGQLSDCVSDDKGSYMEGYHDGIKLQAAKPDRVAPWIHPMLRSSFFCPCEAPAHKHLKKNECTYFCATCGVRPHSLCQHCLTGHVGHQLIQIRRYVYCDVIRAVDINPHVDTTGVQNYIINQAKVMFLNHRPHSKPGKPGAPDTCRSCRRHLREGYTFCSLACKVDSLMRGDAPGPPATPWAAPVPTAMPAHAMQGLPPAHVLQQHSLVMPPLQPHALALQPLAHEASPSPRFLSAAAQQQLLAAQLQLQAAARLQQQALALQAAVADGRLDQQLSGDSSCPAGSGGREDSSECDADMDVDEQGVALQRKRMRLLGAPSAPTQRQPSVESLPALPAARSTTGVAVLGSTKRPILLSRRKQTSPARSPLS